MKEDLRVIRTRNAIENSFINLIEEMGFENVKMVDIAQRANVNRNTIYLHYQTKEMIMEKIIERIFTNELSKFDFSKYPANRLPRRLIRNLFNRIFELIYENIEIYRIILTDQNLYGYLMSKLKKIKSYILENLKPKVDNEIIVEYIVSGVFGIIQSWIVYDRGSVEENVDIIVNLVGQNIRYLQFK